MRKPKMTATDLKALAETLPDRKTVGVPMTRQDLEALGRYRNEKGRTELVTPKEGPAALAIFRAGLRALGIVEGAP